MPFPLHPGKRRHPPLVTAETFHRYEERRTGRPRRKAPRHVILVFGHRWRKYLDRKYGGSGVPLSDLYRVGRGAGVAVLDGPGAPYAALIVEELSALGATDFLIVGMAGSLSPDLPVGARVVCTRALRDEGTSRHYLPPALYALPSRRLTSRLEKALDRAGLAYTRGPTWTTDAPYRETVPELRRYRRAGMRTVEMEAAAVFVVARRLRRRAAALFVISDHLLEDGWEPRFEDSPTAVRILVDVTARALAR